MKHWVLLLAGLAVACGALYSYDAERRQYNKIQEHVLSLQAELKGLRGDLAFLSQHQDQLQFLTRKGWFSPQSRLVGGAILAEQKGPLNTIRFSITPGSLKPPLIVSHILIQMDAVLDTDIYDFISHILRNFPGIIILRKLSLHRSELTLQALRLTKRPTFVKGEALFEWVALSGKKHAD